MALRLRRGTDAERQLITPAEGELVYTTDTKSVYIGDGATVGGIIISGEIGLDDLVEVDLSTPPAVGQVLKWDGAQFVPSDDAENDGIIEGSNYRINIVGDDSSLIVDTSTNTVTGTFVGDGSQLTNLPSSIIEGGTYQFNITGEDSQVILDSATNTFTGNFIGDVQGSVFGDDSSLIIDSVNNIVLSDLIITDTFRKNGLGNIKLDDTGLTINATTELDKDISFIQVDTTSDLSSSTADRGKLFFGREDINGNQIEAIIGGGRGGIYSVVDDGSGTYPESNVLLLTRDGFLGLGTYTPATKLDVRGTASFSGFVQFGSLTTAERTALTATNGMVIYNTTNNKFEGYQNGSWINLDDGTAAA